MQFECSAKFASRVKLYLRQASWITTDELARRTAGGDDYTRTKDGEIKGLALRLDLKKKAPETVVVGVSSG